MDFKGTKNWRIRYADPQDLDSFFFIEADLEKEGFYPRIEVMQEDFGEHNGYDKEIRLADAKLIIAAPKMLDFIDKITRQSEDVGRKGCYYGDTNHCSEAAAYGYNQCLSDIRKHAEILLKEIIEKQ